MGVEVEARWGAVQPSTGSSLRLPLWAHGELVEDVDVAGVLQPSMCDLLESWSGAGGWLLAILRRS